MKRTFTILVVCLLFFFTHFSFMVNAQSNSKVITGQVLDDSTDHPIINATVSLWEHVSHRRYRFSWKLIITTKTNSNGEFRIEVNGELQSAYLFVYFDNSDSLGFDYTPFSRSVQMSEENVEFSIRLLPAASIIFEGDPWFVEYTKPLTYFSFIIEDMETQQVVESSYVKDYGVSSSGEDVLGLQLNHVVVPIDRTISIQVGVSSSSDWLYTRDKMSKSFVIDDIEQLNLTQGMLTRVNIEKYTLWINYDFVWNNLNLSSQLIKEADQNGFHVALEKQDLAKAENLVSLAKTKLDNDYFKEAYSDLREAYLIIVGVQKSLENILANAISSTSLLLLFLSLTAMSLSYILFESVKLKLPAYLGFFIIFFLIFYFTYPGCSIVSAETLFEEFLAVLGVTFLISLAFPRFLKDRFVSTFSLAKRNLRRRKTRFILTLLTIIALVMSFVSLTSFSTGYGLTSKKYSYLLYNIPEGLLIQQPPSVDYQTTFMFNPIEASTVDLFKKDSEILVVAPKVENQPQLRSVGVLNIPSSSQRIQLYGFLGILPSSEANITEIDKIVIEGRYLEDDDKNSILISSDLAHRTGVRVNDDLVINIGVMSWKVTVIGLFDDNLFSSLKDINGKGIIPNKLYIPNPEDAASEPEITSCDAQEVIVTNLEFASKLPAYISRVDAVVNNSQNGVFLATKIALEQGYSVWYSSGKKIFHALLGAFIEIRGLSIFIPLVIVIFNVVVTMLNSIFEYRKEISILSSVGLNPSDIMRLFIAEAAIIGVLGGGVGYMLGIGNYRVMSMLSIVVEVKAKVSFIWSFASVLVSVSTVLVGAFVALGSSVVITPSLRRRWYLEKDRSLESKPGFFSIPFRLSEDELDSLFDHVVSRFRRYLGERGIDENCGEIRYSKSEDLEASIKRVHFNYNLGQKSKIGFFPFQLVATKQKNEETYSFEVFCRAGSEESIKETVSFIRMSMIEWSANRAGK